MPCGDRVTTAEKEVTLPDAPPSSLREMLAENKRRLRSKGRDPISGLRMPGRRMVVRVDGLNPAEQQIPREMASEALVKQLAKAGSIDTYLTDLGVELTDTERGRIVGQWERLRSRYDFYFWAARYARVKNKEGDICPFRLYEPQIKLVSLFERQRLAGRPIRVVLLKARQWGGSTATQIYMAWIQLVLMTGWNSLIVGHEGASTAEVNSMFELLLEYYPAEMLRRQDEAPCTQAPKSVGVRGSANIRRIPSRQCKIKLGSAVRPESVRGGDSSMVHCTEVAFWRTTPRATPVQMMKAATSGVLYKPMTLIVYESSANGMGNFFHEEYTAARAGRSQFESLFVAWYEIEKYRLAFTSANAPAVEGAGLPRFATAEGLARWLLLNRYCGEPMSVRTASGRYLWRLWESGAPLEAINWYVAERSKYTDQADMASEFPTDDTEAFAHTGVRVFDVERLAEMREHDCVVVPEVGDMTADAPKGVDALDTSRFTPFAGGLMKVWHKPEPASAGTERYVVTVDIGGRSAKADWSVIYVLDRGVPGAERLVTAAQWRGHIDHDLLAWKAAQIARWYGEALLVVESNTLETHARDRWVDGDQSRYVLDELYQYYPNLYRREGGALGFHTNTATKPQVISTLVESVRDGVYVERDSECIDEFGAYERRPDGSFGAIPGKHDDMLMTRAIGLYVATRRMDPLIPPDTFAPMIEPVQSWQTMIEC